MNALRLTWMGAVAAAAIATTMTTPAMAAEDEVAAAITRYGVRVSPTPTRSFPRWQKPAKVVLLNFGRWGQLEEFRRAAGGANVVVATDVPSAAAAAVDADIIFGHNPEICDPRIINGAKQLRWIASLNAGVELCMSLPVIKAQSVMMTNMRGLDSPPIAEHAIALMLALAHGLDHFAVDTSKAIWSRNSASRVRMQYMEGKTMLVAGLGGIGTEVARKAHGLGMKVVATRVGGTGKPDFVDYVGQPEELLTLAKTADVIVSAVPLTPQTTGMYDAKFFATLKPTAYFINIARGGSVVTADLMAALNEGRLAGAGLDVVDPEPLPPEHPLWKSPRILFTPHIASGSDIASDARWTLAVDNLRRYVAGEPLLNQVDLQRGF
jgi:phosphoglycerate dehydrogenase-like enzyme